jgi:hypothetical protein
MQMIVDSSSNAHSEPAKLQMTGCSSSNALSEPAKMQMMVDSSSNPEPAKMQKKLPIYRRQFHHILIP